MAADDSTHAARMRTLARLARPTAHDLRGALSAVGIHLELLAATLEAADGPLRDRCRRYLEVVRLECARVHRVGEAFLALASLPAEHPAPDLATALTGVIAAVKPLADTRRVGLAGGALAPRAGGGVAGDACRQRLLDALIDAVERAPVGTELRLELSPDGRCARLLRDGEPCADVRLDLAEDPAGA